MKDKISRRDMLGYARDGLEQAGYDVEILHGPRQVWALRKDGRALKAAVRTTQDRWFVFARKSDGWKTLDEVGPDVVEKLPKIVRGVKFHNGVEVIETPENHAA